MDYSATVIIATTGSNELKIAIDSVLNQTHPTKCYVVCDGNIYKNNVDNVLKTYNNDDIKKIDVCYLPINVGANGFYGHRVYAAFSHLINTKYVMFLDQDNFLEKDHIRYCIETIEKNDLDWCYSLRNICKKNGVFFCKDNCESLGKWKTYHNLNHVDTNTYFLKTKIAIQFGNNFHGGWGQDRILYKILSEHCPKFDCTKKFTINYRVGGNTNSVNLDFFINGNKIMYEKYNYNLPWLN